MGLKRVLFYFTGADFIGEHFDKQQRFLAENTGSDGLHRPLDGDLKTAGRVYADRLRVMFEYPVVVIGRLAGIDAVITAIKKNERTPC